MQELIKVTTNTVGAQVVSARELHGYLEVKKYFTEWFKDQKEWFSEGVDYQAVHLKVNASNGMYLLEKDKVFDPKTEDHLLNKIHNQPLRSVKYSGTNRGSYVDTRQRFGNPVIGISAPNQEWFVVLEFKNYEVSQCQILYKKGFDMMPIIREEIENEWRSILQAQPQTP